MIVGVAMRNEHMVVMLPKPARHDDCFNYIHTKLGVDWDRSQEYGIKSQWQGFYTHTGKYLDREQAYRYALRVGQIKPRRTHVRRPRGLCSEDLW